MRLLPRLVPVSVRLCVWFLATSWAPAQSCWTADGNNSPGSGTQILLDASGHGEQTGTIVTQFDVDWYRVSVTGPGTLVVKLTPPANVNYDLELYDFGAPPDYNSWNHDYGCGTNPRKRVAVSCNAGSQPEVILANVPYLTGHGYAILVFPYPTCGSNSPTSSNAFRVTVDFQLSLLSFGGSVREDPNGPVLSNVKVTWGPHTTHTDSSGHYMFNMVPCGTHTLKFEKSCYETRTIPNFSPPCNASSVYDATLVPQVSFGGIVRNCNTQQLIVGATVSWHGETTVTNQSGAYSFTCVPCTPSTLTISKPCFGTYSANYAPSCSTSNEKNVCLSPSGVSIHGIVRNCNTQQPIVGATVSWHGETTVTNQSGAYSFTCVPCTPGTLAVSKPCFGTSSADYVPSCSTSNKKDVCLSPFGTSFEGIVRDETTRAPIAGAEVAWGTASTTSDGDGHYEFDCMPCGSHDLIATADCYELESHPYSPSCGATSQQHDVALAPTDCECDGATILGPNELVLERCGSTSGAYAVHVPSGRLDDGMWGWSWSDVRPAGWLVELAPSSGNATRVQFTASEALNGSARGEIRWSGACNGRPRTLSKTVSCELELSCLDNVFQFGRFQLRADSVMKTGPNRIEASGNVQVGASGHWLIGVAGVLVVDTSAQTITTHGAVVALAPLPSAVLYDGAVTAHYGRELLEVVSSTNSVLSKWRPAGLALRLESIGIVSGDEFGLSVRGGLSVPPILGGVEMAAELEIRASGVQFPSGSMSFAGPLRIAHGPWSLDQLSLAFEGSHIEVTCEVTLNDVSLRGSFELENGQVNALAVEAHGFVRLGPPVPLLCSPGLFGLTHVGGGVFHLSDGQPLLVDGTLGFVAVADSCLLPGYKIDFVVADPLHFTWDLSGELTFDGEASLFVPDRPIDIDVFGQRIDWNGYPFLSVAARFGRSYGFVIDYARIDVLGIVDGRITRFSIDPQMHVEGAGEVTIRVPDGILEPFGGEELFDAYAVLDDEALIACATAFEGFEICATFAHTGGVSVGLNLEALFEFGQSPPVQSTGVARSTQFLVPAGGRSAMFGARFAGTDVLLELVSPNGETYLSDEDASEGIEVYPDPDAPHSASVDVAMFLVKSAAPGTWMLRETGGAATVRSWFGWIRNAAPSITLASQATIVPLVAGQDVAVELTSTDPDDEAELRFYFSRSPGRSDGRRLMQREPAREVGGAARAIVTMPDDLPPGSYYLYAEADDGKHLPSRAFSFTRYELRDPSVPAAPSLSCAPDSSTGVVRVQITPSTEKPSAVAHRVCVSDAFEPGSREISTSIGGDEHSVVLSAGTDIPAGARLRVRVVPIGVDGREGDSSDEVVVQLPAHPTLGCAPRFVQFPATRIRGGQPWKGVVRVEDADDDARDLRLECLGESEFRALGCSILPGDSPDSFEIHITDPPASGGVFSGRLQLSDSRNVVERTWQITVLGPTSGNTRPEILTIPGVATLKSGETYSYAPLVSDADAGESMTLEILDAPPGMTVARDGDVQKIVWTPQGASAGEYSVSFRAIDHAGAEAMQTFPIVVAPEESGGGGCASDPSGGAGYELLLLLLGASVWLVVRQRVDRNRRASDPTKSTR